ncbi:hypothetical protein Poly30_30550 [Planctomycetes bacterium Poly30]|uniref:Uncharacterized protein n=2 Tax=Saltatorellus ferox TaxID=2528018 RepID=A0A518ETW5_9BACT|nr:hypothetical protein Poly30_30550 [Planctomycetes bacterium Poly30]
MLCVTLAALALAAPDPILSSAPAVLPHVGSYSLSEIHVRRHAVQVQLRCQVLSLGEVIGPFDPDLDGNMEPGELEAHVDAIASYIAEHYRVVPGAESLEAAADPGRALKVTSSLVVEAPPALDPMNEVSQWIDVVLDFSVPEDQEFRNLGVYLDLFQVTSPQHRDSSAVVWNGLELSAWQFAAGSEAHVFEATDEMLARNEHPILRFARAGALRATRALDVVLLVLLFVAAARRGSRGSALLSAGLFLAFAAAGMVLAPRADLLPQHVRFLQLTVPLALSYVGLDDLLHNRGRTRILETSVFGIALGGREATRLAPDLSREAGAGEPLMGFALGWTVVLFAFAVALSWVLMDRSASRETVRRVEEGRNEESPAELASGAYSARPLRATLDVAAIGAGLWFFWVAFRA